MGVKMEEKGSLIVTTKSSALGSKIYVGVIAAIMVVIGCVIVFSPDMSYRMARDILGDSSQNGLVIVIACGLFFGFPLYFLFNTFVSAKSYCDVYESGVAGVAGRTNGQKKPSMEKFEIPYEEIVNITESKKTISIYTAYTTYEVLALKNKEAAVREMRLRAKAK